MAYQDRNDLLSVYAEQATRREQLLHATKTRIENLRDRRRKSDMHKSVLSGALSFFVLLMGRLVRKSFC